MRSTVRTIATTICNQAIATNPAFLGIGKSGLSICAVIVSSRQADPGEAKELISSIVCRIELYFVPAAAARNAPCRTVPSFSRMHQVTHMIRKGERVVFWGIAARSHHRMKCEEI